MPNTNRGFPYPAGGAQPNVPYDMQALAEALDIDIDGLDVRLSAAQVLLSNATAVRGRPDALVQRDSAGFFFVMPPTSDSHPATKNYVDTKTWNAADVTNGTFTSPRIPDLPASRIVSGEFSTSRIPLIPNSKLVSRPWHVRTSAVTVPGGGTAERSITLPSGRFDAAPIVQMSVSGTGAWVTCSVTDLSASSCTVVLRNYAGSSVNVFIYFTANPEG